MFQAGESAPKGSDPSGELETQCWVHRDNNYPSRPCQRETKSTLIVLGTVSPSVAKIENCRSPRFDSPGSAIVRESRTRYGHVIITISRSPFNDMCIRQRRRARSITAFSSSLWGFHKNRHAEAWVLLQHSIHSPLLSLSWRFL